MRLSRYETTDGARWALDGRWLRADFSLNAALAEPADALPAYLDAAATDTPANSAVREVLAPVESGQEVWACGVTYQRSHDARVVESRVRDVYTAVYHAERPEIFFKSSGWRVRADHQPVHIRRDSKWNVPEAELVLVVNAKAEIVGYTAGNDMSSRDIEGENPLYLPQAKVYDGSCSLGPGIEICSPDTLVAKGIGLRIERDGAVVFEGQTTSDQMKRTFAELVRWLYAEMSFPMGVMVMTGTGIVPPDQFTLHHDDFVTVRVGDLELRNPVSA